MAVLLLLGVALVAIPLTVYLAQRQQNTQSNASVVSESTVVAVINGKQIKKSDLRKVAEETNKPADITDQLLKDALLVIEEREILDNAEKTLGIELNTSWVEELVDEGYSEKDAKYQVLKNQITIKAVKSRSALTVQFWNTPESGLTGLTEKEKEDSSKQLSDGLAALAQAETGFTRGDEMLEISDAILDKYESLKPVLAVNGVLLNGIGESERISANHPQIFQLGDSGLDTESQTALFALKKDDVGIVKNTSTNRGGIVFKVISANDTGENTFDAWYAKQKTLLVQNLGVL